MPESPVCPQCQNVIPADAEVCPECTRDETPLADNAPTEAYEAPRQIVRDLPTPEELGKQIPGLEVLELLGRGGMGAVYKARQPKLDRLVAIKIIIPSRSGDPTLAERFLRESRALAKVQHPHIVTVHDVGQEDNLAYYVMEYVEGPSLKQLLIEGRITPQEAFRLVPQICDAMQYAHDQGIVHRDIKPANILVDGEGRAKIADFGLAKISAETVLDDNSLTVTGTRMGTLRYMAPEQMVDTANVDHRADIYSLGVMFYEMLTGDLPALDFTPPSQKARVDRRVDQVVQRSLKESPDERYQQAREIKHDVERIAGDGKSSLAIAATALAVAGLIIAGLVWQIMSANDNSTEASDAESSRSAITTDEGSGTSAATDNDATLANEQTSSEDSPFVFEQSWQTLAELDTATIAVADCNNDGHLDFVEGGRSTYAVWLNDGQGHFGESTSATQDRALMDGLVIFDVDGDNYVDLVYTSLDVALGVRYGNGDGTFRAGMAIRADNGFGASLAAGDLDGDGDLDVVRAAGKWRGAAPIDIFRNEGEGNFVDTAQRLGKENHYGVSLGDLDGDGDLDLVAATSEGRPSRIWLNDGEGQFEDSGRTLGNGKGRAVVLEDFDNDGDLDAFTCVATGGTHQVWLNDGAGEFVAEQELLSVSGSCATAADFDGDSNTDLFVGNFNGLPDYVYLNDGLGHFEQIDDALGKSFSMACAAADFNGDDRIDVIVGNAATAANSIWFNRVSPADTATALTAEHLWAPVNTDQNERFGSLSPDRLALIFLSSRADGDGYDLWQSTRLGADHEFVRRTNLGAPLNSKGHEGRPVLSADGLTLLFASDRVDRQLDLYAASRASTDDSFGEPVKLGGNINTAGHDTAPFLTEDGLALYFSSSFESSWEWDFDLYVASRTSVDEPFGERRRLSDAVNSQREEIYPVVSPDGLRLFFSRGRRGNREIWLSTRDATPADFGSPVLLPPPVSSPGDDHVGFLSDDQKFLYISSNRADPRAAGEEDFWRVELPKWARPSSGNE